MMFFSKHIAWEGEFCTVDVDGCTEVSCFQDAECIDAPAPEVGAECPPCPSGYFGDGSKCAGMFLENNNLQYQFTPSIQSNICIATIILTLQY